MVLVGLFSPVSKVDAVLCNNSGAPNFLPIPDDPPGCSVTGRDSNGKLDTQAPPPKQPEGCSVFGGVTKCLWIIVQTLAFFILKIASFVLWLSGMILDFVLKYTILDMAAHVNGGTSVFTTPGLSGEIKALTGINIAWKVIRDLMNIAFIFLLVYEGIKMIIGQSDSSSAKKFITGVVLASLLINFSLFFTKVMIDASNIVTIGLYSSIITDTAALVPGEGEPGKPAERSVSGLSVPFMNALGLSGFFSTKSFNTVIGGDENMNLVIFYLMGAIVFIVVAFAFFAVSAMFVVRYVTLLILLMLSPIAYMGMALPFMEKYAKEWWASLNGQLLFAPIYMIMNVVILTLMSSDGFIIDKKDNWGGLLAGGGGETVNNDSIGLIFNFVVIIGLVIASLVIAKKTSTEGSKFIGEMTKKVTAAAGGVVMGGAAAVGRRTIGAAGNAVANSERFKSLAFKTDADGNVVARGGLGGFAARQTIKSGGKIAKSSFDARRSAIGENIASNTGISLGKGTEGVPFFGNAKAGEGGFKKSMEDKAKKEKEMMESLKPSDDAEKLHKAEAKRRALEKLNDPAEQERLAALDKAESDKHFLENPDELKDIKEARVKLEEARDKAKIEEADAAKVVSEREEKIRKMEEDFKTASESKELTESEEKIKKLEDELKTAKSMKEFGDGSPMHDANLKMAEEALQKEKANKSTIEGNIKTVQEKIEKEKTAMQNQLEQEKKILTQKVEANKKAEASITANKKEESDKRATIKSDETNALLLDSQEKGKTLYQKRGDAYASSIENSVINQRPGFNEDGEFQWRSSQTAKASAAAVRKTSKGESDEQKLAKLVKEMNKKQKEADKKAGIKSDDDDEPKAPEPKKEEEKPEAEEAK